MFVWDEAATAQLNFPSGTISERMFRWRTYKSLPCLLPVPRLPSLSCLVSGYNHHVTPRAAAISRTSSNIELYPFLLGIYNIHIYLIRERRQGRNSARYEKLRGTPTCREVYQGLQSGRTHVMEMCMGHHRRMKHISLGTHWALFQEENHFNISKACCG